MELQESNWVKPIKTDPVKDVKTAGNATETKEEKEEERRLLEKPRQARILRTRRRRTTPPQSLLPLWPSLWKRRLPE